MTRSFIPLAIILCVISAHAQLRSRSLQLGEYTLTSEETVDPTGERAFVEYNRLGVESGIRRNDYSEALGYFEKALSLNPDCLLCRYNLGRALIKLDRYPEAIETFETLTEKFPKFADAYASIGEVYSLAGRHTQSMRFYLKALDLSPDDPITLNNYANSLDKLGEYEKAIEGFDHALKFAPDLVEAHCSRGATLYKMGKKKEAYESMKRAYTLDPNDAQTNNNLGVMLDDMGKKKSAFKYYKEAVRLKPDFANAVYNLGLMHIERGERKEAAEQLRSLEKLDPVLAKELQKVLWSKWVLDAGQVASS